jgi:hypothetical protein
MADGRTDRSTDRRFDLMGSPTGLRAPDQLSEDRIDTTRLSEGACLRPIGIADANETMIKDNRRRGGEDVFGVAGSNQPHRDILEAIPPLSRPTHRMSRKKLQLLAIYASVRRSDSPYCAA